MLHFVSTHMDENGLQNCYAPPLSMKQTEIPCLIECMCPFLFGSIREEWEDEVNKANRESYPKFSTITKDGFQTVGLCVNWSK